MHSTECHSSSLWGYLWADFTSCFLQNTTPSRAASHALSPCHISPPRSRSQRLPSWQTSRRARWCAASSAWTRCWRRCDKPPASWETPSWGARWRRPPWPSAGTSSSPPPSTPTERRRHACSQVLLCVQGVRCMLAMVYVPPKKHVYMRISEQEEGNDFKNKIQQTKTQTVVIYCTVIKICMSETWCSVFFSLG